MNATSQEKLDSRKMTLRMAALHANIFQTAAHAAVGQVRKYSNIPYYTHPQAVAELLIEHAQSVTADMVMAAYLHDVIEDTQVKLDLILQQFGPTVALYVDGLTERQYPGLNRAKRKILEAERLSRTPREVKTIKLCDLLHNTADITKNDPDFARVYMVEKRFLLDNALLGGDEGLWSMADAFVREYKQQNA